MEEPKNRMVFWRYRKSGKMKLIKANLTLTEAQAMVQEDEAKFSSIVVKMMCYDYM